MRPEHELRREANLRRLFDNTMEADTNGRHGQSIYEIQNAVEQVRRDFQDKGLLQGANREAALKTVIGQHLSSAGFDPEIIDGDTPRAQARFKQTLFDGHERGALEGDVLEQAQKMTRDQQQDRARGASNYVPERAAAEPER